MFNNEVGGSSLFGIKLAQDERRQTQSAASPRPATRATATWSIRRCPGSPRTSRSSNNVFGNGGHFQLYALDGKTNRAVDTWNLTINGNLFNKRVVKTDPTMVAWGKGDNVTLERYETPAALAAAKNGDLEERADPGPQDPGGDGRGSGGTHRHGRAAAR